MGACCNIGDEYQSGANIITETENFFVVPTLGQMGIEGYIMICSKDHYRGVGSIPQAMHSELDSLASYARDRLSDIYGSDVIVFEHGPKILDFNGGSCLEHAHLHMVPVKGDITSAVLEDLSDRLEISDRVGLERIQDYSILAQIFNRQETSYMFLEDTVGRRFAMEVNFLLPSQYIRMMIAHTHDKNDWDWKSHPGHDLFKRSVETLQDKF